MKSKEKGFEWQVSNLDLSKRLKELGVKQASVFYWQRYTEKLTRKSEWDLALRGSSVKDPVWSLLTGNSHDGRRWTSHWCDSGEEYSAFTVAELGELIGTTAPLPKLLGDGFWQVNFYIQDEGDESIVAGTEGTDAGN